MHVLGIVPARGGSKGIPGKNLVPILGRPLLAWTAAAALASTRLTRAILSTDDDAIAEAGLACGLEVPFMRLPALAGDETPMIDVLRHAVARLEEAEAYRPDILVLLQPTSPLRRAEHIDAAVDLLMSTGADSVVSVVEVPHQFNPVSVMRMESGRLVPYGEGPPAPRRQDKPRVYGRNGPAVLALRTACLEEHGRLYGPDTRPLIMTAEDSIDIDSPWEIALVSWMLARRS